jgi:hypothetical protein
MCLGAGVPLGMILMVVVGHEHKPLAFVPGEGGPTLDGKSMAPPGGGGGKGGKGGKGMPGKASVVKGQLVELVAKLDLIARKPPTLSLTSEEKAKLLEQLDGLDKLDELSDRKASERLAAIVQIVLNEKDKLEAAGYTIPGSGMPFGGGAAAAGDHAQRVKSLREKLSEGKAS